MWRKKDQWLNSAAVIIGNAGVGCQHAPALNGGIPPQTKVAYFPRFASPLFCSVGFILVGDRETGIARYKGFKMIGLQLNEGAVSRSKDRALYGKLGDVSLDDLVQLISMNKRTAVCTLERNGNEGKILFKNGEARHACVGPAEGEEALLELLEWTDAHFVVEESKAALKKVTITKNVEALMLTMFAQLDELRRRQSPVAGGNRKAANLYGRGAGRHNLGPDPQLLSSIVKPERRLPFTPILAGIAFLTVTLLGAFGWISATGEARSTPTPIPQAVPQYAALMPSLEMEVAIAQSVLTPRVDQETKPQDWFGKTDGTLEEAHATPEPDSNGYLLAIVESWAEVEIDGQKWGKTPLKRIELPAGDHTISLWNDNFAGTVTDRFTISPGKTVKKRYYFNELGYLQLVVFPWAEVFIDGRHYGQTPIGRAKIPAGEHTLTLVHPELGTKEITTQIVSDDTTVLCLAMEDAVRAENR